MYIVDSVLKKIGEEDIVNKEIIVPEGVTEIDEEVFRGLDVKSIKLPSTLKKIKENTFYDCNIEILEIPEGVKTIEPQAFYGMDCLKKISIAGTVKNIGYGLFESCHKLEKIVLGKGVEIIPKCFAKNCTHLKEIIIPNTVKVIEDSAFFLCSNLRNITIPEGVKTIEESAFEACSNLEEINFSKGLKKIEKYAFENCESLKKLKFPEGLETIEHSSFRMCKNLEEIYLPDSIRTIGHHANYMSVNLKRLITPWGSYELENTNTISLLKSYIFLYINHLLKSKYSNLQDLENDEYIGPLLNSKANTLCKKDGIYKFKLLYSKMRKSYDVNFFLLEKLKKETIEQFSYKTWNQIKDILPWKDFPFITDAFANIIEIFGLFYNDEEQEARKKTLKQLFASQDYRISKEDYKELLVNYETLSDTIKKSFKKVKSSKYFLNASYIPSEFEIYLSNVMSEEEIKRIKKINGTFGKRINDFIKENYKKYMEEEYELIDKNPDSKVRKMLFSMDLKNQLNVNSIKRIFEECQGLYNPDFYQFLIENINIVIKKENAQGKIHEIQSKFDAIQNYYRYQSGNKIPSIKQALDYLQKNIFDYHKGNYELCLEVKNAGVFNQETFDYFQEQFEKNDTRKLRSLIGRSNVYKIGEYTIKAELLRKDDPFTMLVGEDNYTNCCQRYGKIGHNCMVHAVIDPAGGIFVTKLLKDGEWILLTESWDWQNNNVYCHDNIEGTETLKKAGLKLKEAVATALKLDAEYIIEKSNEKVEKQIQKRKSKLNKLPIKEQEKELKELEELEKKSKIKVVTIGDGNDDLGLDYLFNNCFKVNQVQKEQNYGHLLFEPTEYDFTNDQYDVDYDFYSDSNNTQYIIAGSIEELFSENINPLVPIYRDQRRIVFEQENQIRDYTLNKVENIKSVAYQKDTNFEIGEIKNTNIYLGEDWYLIYEKEEEKTTKLLNLAKKDTSLEDEKGIQLKELIHTIYHLIQEEEQLEANLEGDRIIELYQINKQLGYIEPVLEETKLDENENTPIYHVIFKKGPNFNKKEKEKQKQLKYLGQA